MRRRGVAMVMAIALMGFTTTILVVISTRVQLVSRRTEMSSEESQASQLLRAGIQIASLQQKSGHPVSGTVPTPAGQIKLDWSTVDANTERCTIAVDLPHTHRTLICRVNAAGVAQAIQ